MLFYQQEFLTPFLSIFNINNPFKLGTKLPQFSLLLNIAVDEQKMNVRPVPGMFLEVVFDVENGHAISNLISTAYF